MTDTINRNRSARHFVVNMPLVEVTFSSHVSTGSNEQTRPGLGLDVMVDLNEKTLNLFSKPNPDGKTRIPCGVIPRDHVKRLMVFCTEFLKECGDDDG